VVLDARRRSPRDSQSSVSECYLFGAFVAGALKPVFQYDSQSTMRRAAGLVSFLRSEVGDSDPVGREIRKSPIHNEKFQKDLPGLRLLFTTTQYKLNLVSPASRDEREIHPPTSLPASLCRGPRSGAENLADYARFGTAGLMTVCRSVFLA
jgi:hypothetical protein